MCCAPYRMPVPGLYQTGDTTYPGGSVTGAPGRNAAVVMLRIWYQHRGSGEQKSVRDANATESQNLAMIHEVSEVDRL